MKNKILLVAIVVACGILSNIQSFAQGYMERINLSYDYLPLKIKDPAGDQKFSGSDVKLSIVHPIALDSTRSKNLIIGGNFEAFHFGGTHADLALKNVYSVSPTIGYSTMVSRRFNLTTLLIPLLNSDYKNIQGSDIHFGAIARGSYFLSRSFTLLGSVGYRYQYYGPQYIILAGFDWKVNEKWRLYGEAPSNFNVSYNLSKNVMTGFDLYANNTSYRLNDQERYLKYNTVQPGLFLECKLSPVWAIRGTAAYSLQRNIEVYNKNDKVDGIIDFVTLGTKPVPLNTEISKGAEFKVALSFRFPSGN